MTAKLKTPAFLSRAHLARWLRESPDGRAALDQARPYSFASLQELEQWLQNTAEGSDLLSRFRDARRKVLLVLYADGWVEAYARRDVDVRIAVKPYAATAEGGVLADRYLEACLPAPYAELFAPGFRRGADKCRKVTADQLLAAALELDVLRAVDRMRDV